MPEVKNVLIRSIIDKDLSLRINKVWSKKGEKYNLFFGEYCNSGDHITYGWFFLAVYQEPLKLNFRCHKIKDNISNRNLDEDEIEEIFLIKEGSKSAVLKLFHKLGEQGLILREFSFQIFDNYLLLDLQNFKQWKEINSSTFSYFFEKIIGLSNKLIEHY